VLPFENALVFEWLEAANCQLGAAFDGVAGPRSVPRLVCAGPGGIWISFEHPVGDAPPPWQTVDGGKGWHLAPDVDMSELRAMGADHGPWLAMLLAIGDNAEGTWLVPAEPGSVISVLGSQARASVASLRRTVLGWSWADDLMVTDDPAVAERGAQMTDAPDDRSARLAVLFVGDPTGLDALTRRRCAVLTTTAVAAADLGIMVDDRAASLHPTGVTVRPHLLSSVMASGIDEATTAPSPAAVSVAVAVPPSDGVGVRISANVSPGVVNVSLLTPIPRLDGLAEALDPKRARRATELVAYLALHHGDPVTSDRLRTRVLGSADADAASKTLFNVVGAARKALGDGPNGQALLPPGTKAGLYRISELVTVDALRAVSLVEAATRSEDSEESIAFLRAGLELIEGPPLDAVLSGYSWWSGEGHDFRIGTALVDGACRLSRLATDAGLSDLAQWALGQGRIVEPYSEALTRAAMQWAASAGDIDRLRREWLDCRRRAEELEPGGLPSESTGRIYAELSQRAPAYVGGAT